VKAALLRFAPVYDPRIVTHPKLARSLMVQAGALERVNRDQPVPVLVDHDDGRVVGEVREIATFPETDGRTWLFASVALSEPPEWLKRNGGVSWGYKVLQEQDVNGTRRLLRAFVTEISVLSPSVQPDEPLARVTWIGEQRLRARTVEHRHPPGRVLRRPNSGYVIGVS
jgi:hypothetical protein